MKPSEIPLTSASLLLAFWHQSPGKIKTSGENKETPSRRQELHCQLTHSLRLNPINQTAPDLITTTRRQNLPIAEPTKNEAVNQYSNKFKRLDKQYAADIVGNGDNRVVGLFESAQKRFIGGQAIPLVIGPFGEVNEDFEKVLKILARLAAAGEDGKSISSLCNTYRKGGAIIIMLQQFRRALGVMVVRGMANHKLSRLHYGVRATQQRKSLQQMPTIVIIDGKLGDRGVAAGILVIYQRDMQLMNNSVMETTLEECCKIYLCWI
eukprot:scaffold210996_cov63-Cyclotella_meneghiniana.AAC.6